jgi:hypothetical protein
MSNKILIEYEQASSKQKNQEKTEKGIKYNYSFTKNVISVPLLDDILLEVQSQFSSFGELIPQVKSILEIAATAQSSLTAQVGGNVLNLLNKFDIPTWKKTDPLRFQTTLTFYAGKNGAYEDVFLPITDLTNYVMLIKTGNSYRTPGINLKNVTKVGQNGNKGRGVVGSTGARLMSVFIPGMVYIPQAFLRAARPTFSKYLTTSGYPVWGKLDVQFESLVPASDLIWDNVKRLNTYIQGDEETRASDEVTEFKNYFRLE